MTPTERRDVQTLVTTITGWYEDARDKSTDRSIDQVERSYYRGTRHTCDSVLKRLAAVFPDLDDDAPDSDDQ